MKVTLNSRWAYRFLAGGSLLSLAGAAMAAQPVPQTTSEPTPTAAEAVAEASQDATDRVETITITAQRRAENLQDVAISVVALTGDSATSRGIVTVQALGQQVPGLQFDRVPTASTPFLRGVGTPGSTIGNEPSIAFYVDDIYIPNGSASAFEFNNIASVEVLRGPQGTLFGRNAVGGLINLRTRQPEHDASMDVSVGYGNYDTLRTQLYATAGLGDLVAANIAAYYNRQGDGWGTNVITGNDAYRQRGWGVRAQVLLEPNSDLSVRLIGDHEWARGDIGIPGRVATGTVAGTSNRCVTAPITGCSGAFFNPDARGAGFYDTTGDVDNLGTRIFSQAAMKVRLDLGTAVLQSISSYTFTKFWQNAQDNDNTPYALQSSHYPQFQRAFTQELQLASARSSPVQWILGAFYFRDRSTFDGFDAFRGVRVGNAPAGIYASSRTRSYAFYAQATGEILPRTNLTAGIRYTHDNRDFETRNLFLGVTSATFTDDHNWSAVTGRLAIDYHINDDIMIYAAANRGYKSGVYNLAGFGPGSLAPPIPPVDPERLDAFSGGVKTELFDHHVRFNVEGFLYNYKNIQLFNVVPAGTELRNAAGARVYGVDIDVTIVPVRHLTFVVGAELLHGRYTSFPVGQAYFPIAPNAPIPIPANGCPAIGAAPAVPPYPSGGTNPIIQRGCDLSGQDTIQTPPFSINVSGTYDVPTTIGNIDFTAAFSHRARYFFEADNTYTSRQPATNFLNASMGWTSSNGTFGARLWGNNLTKEESYTYRAPSASVGVRYAPRAPRTYGLTLNAHF